jgi:hypothetical protein
LESLRDADSSRAIVVCIRGRQERKQVVTRILVSTKDSQGLGKVPDLLLKARDNRRLRKGVGEIFKGDVGAKRGVVNDL